MAHVHDLEHYYHRAYRLGYQRCSDVLSLHIFTPPPSLAAAFDTPSPGPQPLTGKRGANTNPTKNGSTLFIMTAARRDSRCSFQEVSTAWMAVVKPTGTYLRRLLERVT
jgi:hypothetical protein